jgi:hypothetical protein
MHGAPSAENRSRLQAGVGEIFGQGLGGGEMEMVRCLLPFSLIVM